MNATASSSGPEARAGRPARAQVRSADGLGLVAFRWQGWAAADGGRQTPRATVALLHGLAEHARRYDALAARLAAAGIELVAIDLRGHGCSPGRRTWVDRFDQYLDDADALVSFARREDVPLFLMGHSMGGAIAALYAIERAPARGQPFAGLVLSSPALAPGRDVPRWMLAASRFMSRAWPRFPALKIDAALLSRDPEVVAANRADPLVQHGAVPARTGAEILVAMERIARARLAGAADADLPRHRRQADRTGRQPRVRRAGRAGRQDPHALRRQLPRDHERPRTRARDRRADRLDRGAQLNS